MKKQANIPMVTKVVAAGDPKLKAKAQAQSRNSSVSHIDELNQRIDELETAIGQDNSGPIGRAFAIRAESNRRLNLKRKVAAKPSSRNKKDGVS